MLKILIIEDEEPAAKRLLKMIKEAEPDVQLLDTLVSVSAAVAWFKNNPCPDIIFSDIQLADGISFEIFKTISVNCPVIFITAFDQYAIEAFKVNSIDYLLKPVKKEELQNALEKFKRINTPPPVFNVDQLMQAYQTSASNYKQRFVVKYGEHLKTITTQDVAYFYTEDKVNFLTNKDGRRYVIDFNLDTLETLLDPKLFFRINRQFIISIDAI
ncbi:MAG: LytTR family DNA-binding domain-containing protein, partial [Ferruginibacter sp.]